MLKPDGILSLGMKLGQGEARDDLGRLFAYYQVDELHDIVSKAGFQVTQTRCVNGFDLPDGADTFVVLTATCPAPQLTNN